MTIEFGRGKDKQKRKARRKKIYGEIREQGRRDAREGTAGENQRRALNMSARGMAAYAAGRGDVAVNRAKKKYGEMRESLGEKGAAALGKAKDYMSKAKSAAGELTGKARSAVASGYSAVKGKAQDLLKKRKGGSAESYARAIEALEFEVAKQVGILEFASGRNYIEFARTKGSKDKTKRRRRIMQGAAALGALGVGAAGLRYGGAALAKRKAMKGASQMPGELAPWNTAKNLATNKANAMPGARGTLMNDISGLRTNASRAYSSTKKRAGQAKDWAASKMPKRKAD